MTIRIASLLTGITVIGAAVYANVAKLPDGPASPVAVLHYAAGLALVVSAAAIGRVWRDRQYALVFLTFVGIASGEIYGLVNTGERAISAREAARAPTADASINRTEALKRVNSAEKALAAAERVALDKAAEKGCQDRCVTLLNEGKASARLELSAARKALEALPVVAASATPLAARIGITEATMDLVAGALAWLGINGLGACLIAIGAHTSTSVPMVVSRSTRSAPHASAVAVYEVGAADAPCVASADASPPSPRKRKPARSRPAQRSIESPDAINARQHAARFAVECLAPVRGARLPAADIVRAYRSWTTQDAAIPKSKLAAELAALFSSKGFAFRDGALIGVAVKEGAA